MGINAVFGPNARLDKLTKSNGLLVGDVFHTATMEINEQGAEAAAVSSKFNEEENTTFGREFRINQYAKLSYF